VEGVDVSSEGGAETVDEMVPVSVADPGRPVSTDGELVVDGLPGVTIVRVSIGSILKMGSVVLVPSSVLLVPSVGVRSGGGVLKASEVELCESLPAAP
jgi:hypothetical protein